MYDLPGCVPPLPTQVRSFVGDIGFENMGKRLINSREGKVNFERPRMTLDILMKYGQALTQELEELEHKFARRLNDASRKLESISTAIDEVGAGPAS